MESRKSICIVTGTRAEYGLLRPLIKRLGEQGRFEVRLLVTGMHLCPEFGMTFREIEQDNIPIDAKIEMQLSSDTSAGMAKSTGLGMISFTDYFTARRPDLLIVLGDRYEIFACSAAAALMRIPIAHIHGGETTEGAVDEFIRHAITKMSLLHFTSCEDYRKRVIQLGEHPDRVFNVGALGAENIRTCPLITVAQLSQSLDFPLVEKEYCVVTFHPVTLEYSTGEEQVRELTAALDRFPQLRFIITKSNADAGGRRINQIWDEYAGERENCYVTQSLGLQRYLSALKGAACMIGNSSSGILEGPASKIPTVNIGDRQKGRIMAESILSCPPEREAVTASIRKAISPDFQAVCRTGASPYGDGRTSPRIVGIIEDHIDQLESTQKRFYDLCD